MKDTTLIEEADAGIPPLLIHGTDDMIVPFGVGPSFSLPILPATYGSDPISKRLAHLGISHDTYFVEGEGHEFYGVFNGNWNPAPNAYWDTITVKVAAFLHKHHRPHPDFSYSCEGRSVHFTDLSEDVVAWIWDFGDGNYSRERNPVHTYTIESDYTVTLKVYNRIRSGNTISKEISIIESRSRESENGQAEIDRSPIEFSLRQNRPNPFNPSTVIEYILPVRNFIEIMIIDLAGHQVRVLDAGYKSEGFHTVSWDGLDEHGNPAASGVYLYTLKAGGFTQTKKLTLVR